MFSSLPDPLSGYRLPHYYPDPTSFLADQQVLQNLNECIDISEESLDEFMSMAVATMQSPSPSSEGSGWVSESPTPTLQYDTGVYFHSPIPDGGHSKMTSPGNELHQAMDSLVANDLREYIPNAFRSDCAPVTSSQFESPLDVSWLTKPTSHGELSSTQATYHFQNPDRTPLPEKPTCPIKPTCILPNYNGVDVNHRADSYDWRRDPRAMRECLMLHANGKPLTETFRKSAKDVVATPSIRKASSARRKHAAKFKCPIDGCNADFTRKHNLDNHLRSHCGITDLICEACHLGFTTIPVWKRHKKNCRRPSFPT